MEIVTILITITKTKYTFGSQFWLTEPSFLKCRISPQKSTLFRISYIIHITYFLQTEHRHCITKNFNLNFHELLLVPFAKYPSSDLISS